MLIVTYKMCFVAIRVFMFQNFYQGPCAMVIVFAFIMAQNFARPFDSTTLDRLITCTNVVLFVEILIGVLFCTQHGTKTTTVTGDYHNSLETIFYIIFFVMLMVIFYILKSDVVRWRRVTPPLYS